MKAKIILITLAVLVVQVCMAQNQNAAAVATNSGPFISSYNNNVQTVWFSEDPLSVGWTNQTWYDILNWQNGAGGTESISNYADWEISEPRSYATVWPTNSWPMALTNGIDILKQAGEAPETNAVSPPTLALEHYDVNENPYGSYNERRTEDAEVKLATGGPPGSTQKNLWVISASMTAYTNLEDTAGETVPFTQISIGKLGNLDTNGNLYVVLPDNDPDVITPGDRREFYHNHLAFGEEIYVRDSSYHQWQCSIH